MKFFQIMALAHLISFFFTTSTANAQEQIHIYVGAPGKNKIPIALPNTKGQGKAVQQFYETVRNDLQLSGWVEVIDSNAYIEPKSAGIKPNQFKFEDWEVPGAIALAKTKLEVGDKIRVESWVYDVPGRKKIGAKAFSSEPKRIRLLAHKVANDIIHKITGRHAPFNTRFAVVGKFRGNKEIYVVDFDGENLSRITRNGSINLQPSWNKGGSKIAFTSYMAGNPDLYVANLGLGRISRLSGRSGINIGASWNPNGGNMALTMAPNGNPDIYKINSRTGKIIQRLTKGYGIETSPSYSPDGSQIAFVSERSGSAQIYIMNSDGSGARRLSFQGTHNTDPVFSPDGKTVAYVSRSKTFDVFTINIDGSGLRRITQDMGNNEDPTWSPDGNYIAFSSTRTGRSHIWMSTADGAHQVQLTQGRGGYTNPAWSPPIEW